MKLHAWLPLRPQPSPRWSFEEKCRIFRLKTPTEAIVSFAVVSIPRSSRFRFRFRSPEKNLNLRAKSRQEFPSTEPPDVSVRQQLRVVTVGVVRTEKPSLKRSGAKQNRRSSWLNPLFPSCRAGVGVGGSRSGGLGSPGKSVVLPVLCLTLKFSV